MAAEVSSSSRAISRGATLDDRHLAAEAAEDLRELQTDVAAADDDQVRRHEIDLQHAAVGEIGDLVEARDLGIKARPPTLRKILAALSVSLPT